MDFKLCGVVTIYFPENDVLKNIMTYLPFVEKLFIMDNTDGKSQDDKFVLSLKSEFPDKIVYYNLGSNKGIAEPVNIASRKASETSCSHMLIMDQDSSFEGKELRKYIDIVRSDVDSKFKLYGPSLAGTEEVPDIINIPIITSGSIVKIDTFMEVGGYNEKLFIDEVDHEFSLRLMDCGYKIKKAGYVQMNHTVGKVIVFGKRKYRQHPPFRFYYFSRNYLYLKNNYSSTHLDFILLRRYDLIRKIRKTVIYDKNRFKCIYYLFLGWIHYKKDKWGKGIYYSQKGFKGTCF